MPETQRQQRLLVDTLTERPTAFQVGRVHYAIHPPSLGVYLLSSRLLEAIGTDHALLATDLPAEALRLAYAHRADVLRLIVLNTLRGYLEVTDEGKIQGRIAHLDRRLTTEELAQLLCLVLQADPYTELVEHYGIQADLQERETIRQIKGEAGMVHLGGRTLYGGLIDHTAERYGWTMDYILWGISYTNLRLLSADASTSVYLSEEEQKQYKSKGADYDHMSQEEWDKFLQEL